MASIKELRGFIRAASYFAKIVAPLTVVLGRGRYVAIFLVVQPRRGQYEFLQVRHEEWGCYLFPAVQIDKDDRDPESLTRRFVAKVGAVGQLAPADVMLRAHEELDLVKIKRSGIDLKIRAYFYRFYLLALRDESKKDALSDAVRDAPSMTWMTCNELLNDRNAYNKNRDVINHIALKTQRGFRLATQAHPLVP